MKRPPICRLCENSGESAILGRIDNGAGFFLSYIRGEDRGQAALLPAAIEDYVAWDAPVRVIDAFVDGLDVKGLGVERSVPAAMGRPAYDPRDLLKLYVYGYLNEVRSSRRLERECRRNVEVMWLLGRLAPDFKTIADFRRDNGAAILGACRGLRAVLSGSGIIPRRAWCHSMAQSSGRRPASSALSGDERSPRRQPVSIAGLPNIWPL